MAFDSRVIRARFRIGRDMGRHWIRRNGSRDGGHSGAIVDMRWSPRCAFTLWEVVADLRRGNWNESFIRDYRRWRMGVGVFEQFRCDIYSNDLANPVCLDGRLKSVLLDIGHHRGKAAA